MCNSPELAVTQVQTDKWWRTQSGERATEIPNRGPRPLVNKSGLEPHVSALATDKRLATSSGRRDARPIHGGVSGERPSKSKRRSLGVVLRTYRPALADFPVSPQMFRLTPVSVKSSWALEFSCLYLTTTLARLRVAGVRKGAKDAHGVSARPAMSALGHKRTCAMQTSCPLYPRKRTCAVQLGDVRFVPIADIDRQFEAPVPSTDPLVSGRPG